MEPPAIDVLGIRKQFHFRNAALQRRNITALEDVSFSIAPGKACGLVGPNGSGKTTLLRILSTVLLPCAGTAMIHGNSLSMSRELKSLIGVVPARPVGFGDQLTARKNLEFYAALRGMFGRRAHQCVEELLDRFGLADLKDRPFWVYSTGQRQRLNLARGLLHDPSVLLWDEPCAGLDPWAAAEFRAWIRTEIIGRYGKTLLMATNQPMDVEAMCDQAVYLRQGRCVWAGPVEEMDAVWVRREGP